MTEGRPLTEESICKQRQSQNVMVVKSKIRTVATTKTPAVATGCKEEEKEEKLIKGSMQDRHAKGGGGG
jgi:hypothetical protein